MAELSNISAEMQIGKASALMKYRLEGHTVVEEPNLYKWAEWFDKTDRVVEQTHLEVASDEIKTGFIKQLELVKVSTVFIGLDQSYGASDEPLVFETMVFGGVYDEWQDYAATWRQAKKMHKAMVALVKLSTTLWKPLTP